jgi:hypothetical protein
MTPYGVSNADRIEVLKRKRGSITALCAALESFLSVEVEADIELLVKLTQKPVPQFFPAFPGTPDPSVLVRASEAVSDLEEQIEKLKAAAAKVPGEHGEFMLAATLPGFEAQLKYAREHRDVVQKAIEENT